METAHHAGKHPEQFRRTVHHHSVDQLHAPNFTGSDRAARAAGKNQSLKRSK